jgi:hypothetical protein
MVYNTHNYWVLGLLVHIFILSPAEISLSQAFK